MSRLCRLKTASHGDDGKWAYNEIVSLRKQRDELLAALKSISKITGDAGFNIGGPLEHCPGEIDHDEAKRLLILACEYLKDTSKAAHRAIASVNTCPRIPLASPTGSHANL